MTEPAVNGLATRADLQQAVRAWCGALAPRFSPGGARVRVGHTVAQFDDAAAELEGFARPLWGLAPLAAGGGEFDGWDRYRLGLVNGTDPRHPEYWGALTGSNQRMVEMAAVGFALALAPEQVWEPLSSGQRDSLAAWLLAINDHPVHENNWLFFRVLVNLGLARVGARHDGAAMHTALDRLESFDVGGGWYTDGVTGRCDYYIPWAMHFYGLIYATFAGADDASRADRFRERAAAFAVDHAHWFDAHGAGIPYGRSLTYRFAQSAFWGALAFADVEALPWGVVKGLALRNVRWWADRPVFGTDGTLTLGYAYPNLGVIERYSSPQSPYWALKAALPLAVPTDHPFWRAAEEPLPVLDPVRAIPQAGIVLYRDEPGSHAVALANGQPSSGLRHGPEKYAKFAYSTAFGFSVPAGTRGLDQAAADSMLALADDGVHFRVREEPVDAEIDGSTLRTRWRPFADVEVETWLLPHPPWHLRIHRIRTDRRLTSAEGGFATDRPGGPAVDTHRRAAPGLAWARGAAGTSGLLDLEGGREGRTLDVDPNTNLLMPRTTIPTLLADLDPGEHWLTCAVLADPDHQTWQRLWAAGPPTMPTWVGSSRVQP